MSYLIPTLQGILAVVFGISATSKLRSRPAMLAFATSLASMRLVRGAWARRVAVVVATAEAVVVLLLLVPGAREAGFAAAAALFAVLSSGVAVVLVRGTARPCRCFGSSSAPLAGRHLVRNTLLTGFALAGLAAPVGHPPIVGSLVALLGGGLVGLLVAVLDDLVSLFAPASTSLRRADGVHRRGHGPVRAAGGRQSAADRRRRAPVT